MTRLFGYFLGVVSGLTFIGSVAILIFQLFIIDRNDIDSDYGEILALAVLVAVMSFVVFYYVFKTGFGKTKLEKVKDELEILKIRTEIDKLKAG